MANKISHTLLGIIFTYTCFVLWSYAYQVLPVYIHYFRSDPEYLIIGFPTRTELHIASENTSCIFIGPASDFVNEVSVLDSKILL